MTGHDQKQRPAELAVEITDGSVRLPGRFVAPEDSRAIVLFAHGSGSSRLSPRNTYVANVLHGSGFGTLLFDLLTPEEDELFENRFDIGLLARRLSRATEWVRRRTERGGKLAYFGASTGAAAALQASTDYPEVRAVVSRGGRPDLAWDYLGLVTAPTLLIVGGLDEDVIRLNESALARLAPKEKQLLIVPGATHLFEEAGTLEEVARAAREWFVKYSAWSD